jgi:SAM-dependent methyltransferase
MELGRSKALQENIRLTTIVQDANRLKLDREYDFVIAHASLHHLVGLEHVFQEIRNHLSQGGASFVYEATPRNGMML